MADPEKKTARPASVDDLKRLLQSFNAEGVEYLLIGGYALYALGYQRGTTDIDVIVRPSLDQGKRVRQALLLLPDKVAEDLRPEWFEEGETIRVADAFVVDLMFSACGQTYDTLLPHAVTVDFEGTAIRTLDLEGMLKTKQTLRDKDKLDRIVLERALEELKKDPTGF